MPRSAEACDRCAGTVQVSHSTPPCMKPKLLVVECWGLGDLAIATPFLQAACKRYDVTLLAKPYALDLQPRFWPEVKVIPFTAPWTVFHHKYQLWRWPWWTMLRTLRQLERERYDLGLSARWDPRDHLLLWLAGVRQRVGFNRAGSGLFLTSRLPRARAVTHQYEFWRRLAEAVEVAIPTRAALLPGRLSARWRRADSHWGWAVGARLATGPLPALGWAVAAGRLRGAHRLRRGPARLVDCRRGKGGRHARQRH